MPVRVEHAIACRYVEVNDNLATIVGAVIDTTWVQQFPAEVGAMLAIRVVCPPEELGVHHLHCHVEGPDGSRVGEDLNGEVNVAAPDARQDWLFGFYIPIGVRWQAESEGLYTVHIDVDGSQAQLPMHVVIGPLPGA